MPRKKKPTSSSSQKSPEKGTKRQSQPPRSIADARSSPRAGAETNENQSPKGKDRPAGSDRNRGNKDTNDKTKKKKAGKGGNDRKDDKKKGGKPKASQAAARTAGSRKPALPIVGIGTSAGGLDALERFLRNVPAQSGMAFVIVQHQDPTRKGMIVELLQRVTRMEVVEINDGMKVRPDRVYVIPPNRDLSILKGVLHLMESSGRSGLRLPINFFFRSLAEDQQERGIGVLLTGMGSDGTEGLKAIKEHAGAVFVQEPTSAQFDAMPRSAVDAGLADVIAPVDELPVRILAYVRHAPPIRRKEPALAARDGSSFSKIVILLRGRTGHDFSQYKRSTVDRRIERRMGLHQIDRIADYVRYLQENPSELDLLFKELLIGVTSFFRDPAAWEQLKEEVIPSLIEANPGRQMLRAWAPGCASGEEAYSLAMVFKEAVEKSAPGRGYDLQIFGTDLDHDAIEKARAGLYPAGIRENVSKERLRRFFVEEEEFYRVGKEIREMAIFAPQDVAMDPPFTKLDLIVCRNLLIYLNAELQRRLVPLFHYALNPGGVLFLGNAETIGNANDLFAPLDGKSRLYRRLETPPRAEPFSTSIITGPQADGEHPNPPAGHPANLQTAAEQLLLQRYSPSAVLVNRHGDILYVSGRTGKYLEPAAGKANWSLFAMARETLRYQLPSAFGRVVADGKATTLSRLEVAVNGGMQLVDVTIEPIQEPGSLRGMVMVVFKDVQSLPEEKSASPKTKGGHTGEPRTRELDVELQRTRQELRTAREEMQTSQEELKSANEELQSTNEELQSTNEELTTSKEELQSLNEELHTVNEELQRKVDELSRTSSDMRNLLDSTQIAVLFLDSGLRVRRFTQQASRIIKLIPGDVGRPVTDIASDLVYPEFAEKAQEVLRSLVPVEDEVATHEGQWYQVRIMPYRTLDEKIDGVVTTFLDITAAKELEHRLRETQKGLVRRTRRQADDLVKAERKLNHKAGRASRSDGDSDPADDQKS